jgi:aspartate/methionine/tyrosine aminotransferase
MRIQPLKLERYFAQYEFSTKYLLSSSDCDGLSMSQLLNYADPEMSQLWQDLRLGYTEPLGHPLLRKEIAQLYSTILPEEVLTVVPEEGIFLAMNSILEAGDHLICTFPGYQSLYEIARAIGCEMSQWRPNEADGWRFNPEDLAQLITPKTRLIVVNFPHNPTGSYPSLEDFNRIIAIAREHNITIFSDEMYRFLVYDEADQLPSLVDQYDNSVALFGMSKTFGLAGLRTGWLVTHNTKLLEGLAIQKDYVTICGSAPSEILAIIGLRAKEQIIADNLHKIKTNLELADQLMDRHRHLLSWTKPKAGSVGFPRWQNGGSYAFCQRVVREAEIMLLPFKVYDYGDNHFRLGFGRQNFVEVITIFDEYLTRLNAKGEL